MIIQDNVYGEVKIDERVLIDIIHSAPLQRLKHISQHGLPQEYYYREIFSRYEHSIGVMILLKKLNASVEEQIAGLIHDISHSTFSHAIDWVIGDPTKQNHQDNQFLNYFNSSIIPSILGEFNFDAQKISDIDSFSILEQDAPKLCADRVDYTLRDMKLIGVDEELINNIIDSLDVYKGRIIFKDINNANAFANYYMLFNKEHWMGSQGMFRYHLLSQLLSEALKKHYIVKDDFNKTDDEVINLLYNSKDESIISQLNLLKRQFTLKDTTKDDDEGVKLTGKFRYVDPEVLVDNQIKPLTSLSQEYKSFLEQEKEESKNEIFVKIDSNN